MNILIKILGIPNTYPFLQHETAGRVILFLWDKSLSAYVYKPKDQLEIDLIYGTPRQLCPWTFVPVPIPDAAPGADAGELKGELELLRAEYENACKLVAELHAAAVGEIRGPGADPVSDVAAVRAELLRLEALIGSPPEGSHPDEALPRAKTFHEERLNWSKEVERLRAHIEKLKDQPKKNQRRPAEASKPETPALPSTTQEIADV